MRLTQGLQQSVLHNPTRTATVFENRRRSYAEVIDRVARLAAGFLAMGAKPGDRIAILALNSDAYYEAYYAILWAGCLAVPCNTRWTAAEHSAALADCEPRLLLVDQHFSQMIDELTPNMRERAILIGISRGGRTAEDLIASSNSVADNSGSDDAPAA